MKLLIFLALLESLFTHSSGKTIFPLNDNIVYVSQDPLNLTYARQRSAANRGINDVFYFDNGVSYNFTESDTVKWLIDNNPVNPAEAYVFTGRDVVNNNFVTKLILKPENFSQNLLNGVHRIDLTVSLLDTAFHHRWRFTYRKTQYIQAEVKIRIDSKSRNCSEPYTLSMIEAKPIDAEIFLLEFPILNETTDLAKTYHEEGCDPESIFSDQPIINNANSGDIIHTFLIQSIYGDNKYEWKFSEHSVSHFLAEDNPPFAFQQAHNIFGANKKLGPIFTIQRGNPGWNLVAYHDQIHWYFNDYHGSGDCPAGCIDAYRLLYRISSDGTKEVIDCSSSILLFCNNYITPNHIKTKPEYPTLYPGNTAWYYINGKAVNRNCIPRSVSIYKIAE